MTKRPMLLHVVVACTLLAGSTVCAEGPQSRVLGRVGVDQKPGASAPMDLHFTDRQGNSVTLAELSNGQPTLLQLAWYSCPSLCDLSLRRLGSRLSEVRYTPGEDFQVITVSIDPRDGAAQARRAASLLEDSYQRDTDADSWHVLTGEADDIERLADSLGFQYQYDADSDQFAHPAGLAVLDGEGRISSYLLGLTFSGNDIQLALTRAGRGELGGISDQLVLRCFHFDPEKGVYTLDILWLLNIACLITVAVLLLLVGVLMWRRRSNHRSGNGGS